MILCFADWITVVYMHSSCWIWYSKFGHYSGVHSNISSS